MTQVSSKYAITVAPKFQCPGPLIIKDHHKHTLFRRVRCASKIVSANRLFTHATRKALLADNDSFKGNS